MPIPLGILAVAGAGAAGGGGSFDLLETSLISSNTASVTFSNLNNYSDYKHLQLRFAMFSSANGLSVFLRLNGDTGSNYASHWLFGDGAGVYGQSATSITGMYIGGISSGTRTDIPLSGTVDLLDAFSTSKTKTIRSLNGIARSAGPEICLISGFRNNTAAITSMTILLTGGAGDIAANSRFSLYGIK